MTYLTMFDAVDITQIPASATAVAGYVNGAWQTAPVLAKRFPHARLLTIAVSADHDADCLDIESRDATPDQAAGWVARQFARGITRPCLYASVSTMNQVVTAMEAAKVPRMSLRLWSAHYGAGSHICGPASCKLISQDMDGTQWTDAAQGKDLDESLLRGDFFGEGSVSFTITLPVLEQGADDSALPRWYVHRVQAILNSCYHEQLTIDGSYGALTMAAVKRFQARENLAQDGICESSTWQRLIAG